MPTSEATLNEWLQYLENRPQQTIQMGLDRIQALAERLHLLPFNVPVITVAGTNGKGSTVAALEAIYTEAGYRVGAYTSPHLLYFNERIRFNQQPVSDRLICEAFTVIESVRETIHLTYFEMATLAALLHFKSMQAQVIILEVGLGGRLDATNIVDADVAVITTIDFDHEDYLGHTLEAIGFEKAGILKKSNQILVYADDNVPASILQRASELQVKTICLNKDYEYALSEKEMKISFSDTLILPRPNLHPNAGAAAIVVAIILSERLTVSRLTLQHAMESVYIAGRQQVIYDTICTVLDVSHNPQSVKLLAKHLATLIEEKPEVRVHAVFSGLKDKNLYGLIEPMHSWVDEWYSAVLDNPRAASEAMLSDAFTGACGFTPRFGRSILEAYQMARSCANSGDILVVYGSFYVVSPIMPTVLSHSTKLS